MQIDVNKALLMQIWDQKDKPVILRRDGKGELLRVRMPFSDSNGTWLQNGRRYKPTWVATLRCWELPKAWFNDFVTRALHRFDELYVIQPYREQEKCSPMCLEATGHECQCSCMGAYHGAGNDGSWFEVNETFATKWNGRELACRLMVKR